MTGIKFDLNGTMESSDHTDRSSDDSFGFSVARWDDDLMRNVLAKDGVTDADDTASYAMQEVAPCAEHPIKTARFGLTDWLDARLLAMTKR